MKVSWQPMPEPAGMNLEHHNIKPIANNLRKSKPVAVEGLVTPLDHDPQPAATTLALPSVILLPVRATGSWT